MINMGWKEILKLDEQGYTSYNEERSLGTESGSGDDDDWEWLHADDPEKALKEQIENMKNMLNRYKTESASSFGISEEGRQKYVKWYEKKIKMWEKELIEYKPESYYEDEEEDEDEIDSDEQWEFENPKRR